MKKARPFDTDALAEIVKKARIEYDFNDDIMDEDRPKVRATKYAVSRLGEADRIILIAYCEVESERELARLLGVSKSTIHNKLTEIRNKVTEMVWQSNSYGLH